MAADDPQNDPKLQAAIAEALARRQKAPTAGQAPATGQRQEPTLGARGGVGSPVVHNDPEMEGFFEDEPAPEIPPAPVYFDRAGQTAHLKRPEKPERKHSIWFYIAPIVGVPAVIIATMFYFIGVEFQGEGVADIAALIEAPTDPYKVKPDDEGGLEVPDQDKLIFNGLDPAASGEGAEAEQLLPQPEQPILPTPTVPEATVPALPATPAAPSVEVPAAPEVAIPGTAEPATPEAATEEASAAEATPPPESDAASAPEPSATAVASDAGTGWRIQLAALKSQEAAESAWAKLQKKYPELLGGLGLSVVKVELTGQGTFYRVQAGPMADRAAAADLCGQLDQRQQPCLIVKPQ